MSAPQDNGEGHASNAAAAPVVCNASTQTGSSAFQPIHPAAPSNGASYPTAPPAFQPASSTNGAASYPVAPTPPPVAIAGPSWMFASPQVHPQYAGSAPAPSMQHPGVIMQAAVTQGQHGFGRECVAPHVSGHQAFSHQAVEATGCPSNLVRTPRTVYQSADDECGICVHKKSDLRMLDGCFHYPYCNDCIKRIARTSLRLRCPNCRAVVGKTIRVTRLIPKI